MQDDLISRQAVIDYIYNDLGLGDEENGKDVERLMELEISYRYIKSLSSVNPQKSGWIPVSERLPTKEEYIANNGLFIVSDGNRNYAEHFDIYDSKKFGEIIVFGFRVDKCVIAWMPLPLEPYKAESEEEE